MNDIIKLYYKNYKFNLNHYLSSFPTYISSSVILLYKPNNYYYKAVFSPFKAVICYYNL